MRNFAAVPAKQYIGTPYPVPLSYGGIAGIGIPLHFDWLSYGASSTVPNICAIVDLRGKATSARLLGIRSVYIDNMGSDTPIYVYFPDTQYAVVCQPNAAGWFKVYNNDLVFWVIGLGFLTGSIPATQIIATNLTVESAIDLELQQSVALWRASPVITRGTSIYNTSFSVPALGDQLNNTLLNLNVAGATANILGVQPSGFFYLTNIKYIANGLGGPTQKPIAVIFESTGVAGTLFTWNFWQPPGTSTPNFLSAQPIYEADFLQLKIDATQQYRLRCALAADNGGSILYLTYTYNQN